MRTLRLVFLGSLAMTISVFIIAGYWSSASCQNREAIWLIKSEMEPAGLDFIYQAKKIDSAKSAIYCYYPPEKHTEPVISFIVNIKTGDISRAY